MMIFVQFRLDDLYSNNSNALAADEKANKFINILVKKCIEHNIDGLVI
jgi:hypothetical protein